MSKLWHFVWTSWDIGLEMHTCVQQCSSDGDHHVCKLEYHLYNIPTQCTPPCILLKYPWELLGYTIIKILVYYTKNVNQWLRTDDNK